MTDEFITRMEALADEATHGKLEVVAESKFGIEGGAICGEIYQDLRNGVGLPQAARNMHYLLTAWNELPALCKEVKRLQKMLHYAVVEGLSMDMDDFEDDFNEETTRWDVKLKGANHA